MRARLAHHLREQATHDRARWIDVERPLFHVVLVHPEIPQNTGNIGRLCVGMAARLHLVRPLGFQLTEKALRRAGLDYWGELDHVVHDDRGAFERMRPAPRERTFAFTKWATTCLWDVRFELGDALLFGSETRGLPEDMDDAFVPLAIPRLGPVRSFNLANAVAIAGFEVVRQLFADEEVR
ncbi:MAG: tRNA (cytidine(34)-2'-O)-methyltransferase [Planctomycetes bacterium]|nr:tRNA (cytidine(34)-2'-O)-methyltransferase [Planctomycetota bacterium]MCB9891921.1 tRNA (cytidine(34)-2'-O)-methyltransferase [Planctomycetota bacterium]